MRVLMFGWEFPPMSSGGLGTACYGLTKGLSSEGCEVSFVLPYAPTDTEAEYVNLIPISDLKRVNMIGVNSLLHAYLTPSQYEHSFLSLNKGSKTQQLYGKDLFQEVHRFSEKATLLAQHETFDVIHCHDWMTFLAGINAKQVSGKPLIVHVHATEFDRTGGSGVNQGVYDIERQGMHKADLIISVSQFTKNKIVEHYGISPEKIIVVHNGIDTDYVKRQFVIDKRHKIVLFVGRLTLQKGPDYFIEAAKKCLEIDPAIRFIIAGSGDMEGKLIERTAQLGIGDKVLFAGFLGGEKLDKIYQMADVFVMPSVSEPFGLTPLEAIKNGTPAIISKQSGVSEVLTHCLKVDFWDVNQLVDKILGVLRHEELQRTLKHHGKIQIQQLSWNDSARKCIHLYNDLHKGTV